jgi:hypothetical protein
MGSACSRGVLDLGGLLPRDATDAAPALIAAAAASD